MTWHGVCAGPWGGKSTAKGKAWSSCRRGHGGGARPGRRHVTTMKLEETATMDKHGAAARLSLWKFCLPMGDSSGKAQREAKSAGLGADGLVSAEVVTSLFLQTLETLP